MNEAQYFTQQYEEDESLTEAFGQLRAVIGDTLDTRDVRGFAEDENVSEHKLDLSNQSTSSQFRVTYDPVVTVLKREWDDLHKRVDDLEHQRNDLAAAIQPLAEAWHGQSLSDGNILMREVIDLAVADIKRAADALAQLEGDERE